MIFEMLVINADDYGYARSYDAGIVEAATAGALDGASVMVMRNPNPASLLVTGVAVGLHLEPDPSPAEQLAEFRRLFGRPPQYIDGHHHCHADRAVAREVADLALGLAVPVRSIDAGHRRLLRDLGVRTADRLVGRSDESEAALPDAIVAWLGGGEAPSGVTEWFVHPGNADPAGGSSYDAGRAEDLELLLDLGDRRRWAARGVRRAALPDAIPA